MRDKLIEKSDAQRILDDASAAIYCLQGIKTECYKSVSYAPYIREKAEMAKRCVTFILTVARQYEKEAEQNDTV